VLFRGFVIITEKRVYLTALVLALGFGLRFLQLGRDSLWNDEAGVVLAALSSTIQGTIEAVRSHAMAMPLDYLIIRLVTKISLNEFVLRLPAAFFGSLTLFICYYLFNKLVMRDKEETALFATLLLALSPLHIMYSQEVRFYSSLVFFYNLSTLLLLEAIEKDNLKQWIMFSLVLIIGEYFHIFVFLSVINGAILILLKQIRSGPNFWVSIRFLASLAIAFVALVPGYVYFGAHQRFNNPLLPGGASVWKVIALGLGWLELPFTSTLSLGQVWHVTSFGLFLVGMIICLKQRESIIIALLVSVVIQIFLIILADIFKGYWFAYRQILQLLPYTLVVSAKGISALLKIFGEHKFVFYVLIIIVALTSIPALSDYYQWSKSDAYQISEYILTHWSPGDMILVVPGYPEKVYRYYLGYIFKRPDIAISVYPYELRNVAETIGDKNCVFLVVIKDVINEDLSDSEIAWLLQDGFVPIRISSGWLGHSLFVRR